MGKCNDGRVIYHLRLAFNMLWCASLLWPFGTMPRETISGFIGRSSANGVRWAQRAERFIDWLHPMEVNHCLRIARMEAAAREVLYPEPENECYR